MKTILSLVFLILLEIVEAQSLDSKCKEISVFKKCLQDHQTNLTRYSSCVNKEIKLCKEAKKEEIELTKRSRVASKCTHFIWMYKEFMVKYCTGITTCYWFKYKIPVKICTMS